MLRLNFHSGSGELYVEHSVCMAHSQHVLNEPPRDKTNKVTVRPAKTPISLGIRKVWSESSLCAQWVAKDHSFLLADSEDSDQTGRMPRLVWVFAGRTVILLVLSWGGSNVHWFVLSRVGRKRSTCTQSVYYRKSIWLVTVYHLTCVNKQVAERVSMFNVSLLFFISFIVENRRMSYAVAMNIDNTDTRFTRKSRRFLQVLFLP